MREANIIAAGNSEDEKEVHPNLKFRGPTRRDVLHDPENALLSRFGAEMMVKG